MAIERLGRNSPCWCGSGIKFKRCHLNRESEPSPTHREVIEEARRAYSSEYCLHPNKEECEGGIIRAHSIQRSGLSRIARQGKVYSFKDNNVADVARENGLQAPKLVGIGSASTFTGFCSRHDNSVFAPIEKRSFIANEEHSFLLAYRHLCMELFSTRAVLDSVPLLKKMDGGWTEGHQRQFQERAKDFHEAKKLALNRVNAIKREYDQALVSNSFAGMKYYVVRINKTPEIMCCSGKFPTFDFDGCLLQDLAHHMTIPDHVTFSIIPTDCGGAVVLSWLGESISAERLVRSLAKQSNDELIQSVVRFVFEFIENCYFSTTWWNSMTLDMRNAIRRRVSTAVNFDIERKSNCLLDDGLRYVDWAVAARETNLNL